MQMSSQLHLLFADRIVDGIGADNARAALQAGVTTLRDLGARGRTIHEMRDAIDKDIVPGPRILSSGAPITCLGGHIWNLENSRIWW